MLKIFKDEDDGEFYIGDVMKYMTECGLQSGGSFYLKEP
jgi:hypothetical protein